MVFITLPSPSLCHCSVYSDCIFKWPFPLDRSKQLLGPCLVCSAYQHALAFDINIGECGSSASLALVFFVWGFFFFAFPWHTCLLHLCLVPTAWIFRLLSLMCHNVCELPQLTGAGVVLLCSAAAQPEVTSKVVTLPEENGHRNWPTRRIFLQQLRD